MPSTTFTLSSALCLILAVGPASVFSAPQLPGLPILGGDHDAETGHSEHDAGAGYTVGIPDGPSVKFGAGVHSEHNGPCGPGASSVHNAGAGYEVGQPDGPSVKFGAGVHSEHDAYPCPEIVEAVPPPGYRCDSSYCSDPPPAVEAPPATETYMPSFIPPTYTTPINIPTITTPAAYVIPTPVSATSTPLIHYPVPSSTPPSQPMFNSASALVPSSAFAIALSIMLGAFA
ncbi:hypothetical protein N7481_005610 [Penicillium waksmanii]|uniref:uncharacterized protein n=1 Tax=Penicillium waksmanii TaxID=69791 RepID=UPI00254836EB|nr:uncharacterized protein N7481_005610 [Penicillium waksmanii]KAJ5983511.1 hypothetical protein N7481_005610 [Penicillium waksmanii]